MAATYESDNSDEDFDMTVHDAEYSELMTGKLTYLECCREARPPLIPISAFIDNLERTAANLRHHSIGPKPAAAIAKCLEKNQCLQTIDMAENFIGDAGAIELADALRSNRTLTELDVSNNAIGVDGCLELVSSIRRVGVMRKLLIGNNKASDRLAGMVGTWLRSSSSLLALDLSRTSITPRGASTLCDGLQANNHLRELNLSWNEFGKSGGVALFRALESCRLTALNASFTGLEDDAGFVMANMLKNNTCLTVLDVSHNNFSHRTATALACVMGGLEGVSATADSGLGEAQDIAKILLGQIGGGKGRSGAAVSKAPASTSKPPAKSSAGKGSAKKPAAAPKGPAVSSVPPLELGPAPHEIVRASLPPLEPAATPNGTVVALRIGHNPLSFTGTSLLVQSLVANSCLSVLDVRQTLSGDGPRYHALKEQRRTKIMGHEAAIAAEEAAAARKAAAKSKKKGKGKSGKSKGKGKEVVPPAAPAAGAGGEPAPPPPPLGGGTVVHPVKFEQVSSAQELKVVAESVGLKRTKLMKVLMGYPDAEEV